MTAVGYARLAQHPEIKAKRPAIVAEVRPVSRLDTAPGIIKVPSRMAPDKDDVYGHIMFALKHEGINLQILSQAVPLVPEPLLREEFDNSPNSQYLRRACFLWEQFYRIGEARRALASYFQWRRFDGLLRHRSPYSVIGSPTGQGFAAQGCEVH